jgi:malate dehydrogenase (oxaloacetate-decarboxylating)
MPVMEGKAPLLKEFAGVDAFPLRVDTTDVDEILAFVKAAAPGPSAGSTWRTSRSRAASRSSAACASSSTSPSSHDDQHGTAIVTLAALLNALPIVGKWPEDVKVVVTGAGAAGVA